MQKIYQNNLSVLTIFVMTCLAMTTSTWAQTPISFDLGSIPNGTTEATITSNEDSQYTLTVSTEDDWGNTPGLEVRTNGSLMVSEATSSSLEMQLVFSHNVILRSYHIGIGTAFPDSETSDAYNDNQLKFSQSGTALGFIAGPHAYYRGAFHTSTGHTHLITNVINPEGTLHTTTIMAGTPLVLESLNPDNDASVGWTALTVVIPEPSSYALIICLGAAICIVVRKRAQRAQQ